MNGWSQGSLCDMTRIYVDYRCLPLVTIYIMSLSSLDKWLHFALLIICEHSTGIEFPQEYAKRELTNHTRPLLLTATVNVLTFNAYPEELSAARRT
jgi:hypothetical protein